jgi:hypothetical protein
MTFWIGSNDVSPHGFSGLREIIAASLDEAKQKAKREYGNLPVDPRRKDKTLRLAVVPRNEMSRIPGGTSPGGLRVPSKYIVECK